MIRIVALLALLLSCIGCESDEPSICEEIPNLDICVGAQACVPGEVKICPCGGGEEGLQTCNEEGTGLSPCECAEEEGTDADLPISVPIPDASSAGECEPQAYTDCDGDKLHWFDSCLEKGELIEVCDPGLCATGKQSCCEGKQPLCYQGDIYWFDACGTLGDVKESCPEGTACIMGEEEGALPTCEVQQECQFAAYEACHNPVGGPNASPALGDVYSHNSCDEPEGVVEVCECQEICANAACVKTFWDGKWSVTLQGNCGLGTAINYNNVVFSVTGNNMTVTASVAGKEVTYNGTMDCDKSFEITGTLVTEIGAGLGSVSATETWNCQFESLTYFKGQVIENSDFGTCLYDLEGYRNN